MEDNDAKRVLEAVLFSSADPVSSHALNRLLKPHGTLRIASMVKTLNQQYSTAEHAFHIAKVGEAYQMRTLPMFKPWLSQLSRYKPTKLSPAALEILSIIAYRQPVSRAEVEHLRGVDSSNGLRGLLEKRLVRITGRDEGPGRPLLYGVAGKFFSLFGISTLKELPTLEALDIPELPQDGLFSHEEVGEDDAAPQDEHHAQRLDDNEEVGEDDAAPQDEHHAQRLDDTLIKPLEIDGTR